MALLLAPYTNAMRLGQGFNTYTQQICIDDAVIVDPERAENVLTNDGTTMRIMAAISGRPSAWNRLTEVINEGPLPPRDPPKALLAAEESMKVDVVAGASVPSVPSMSEEAAESADGTAKETNPATLGTSDASAVDAATLTPTEVPDTATKVEDSKKIEGVAKDLPASNAISDIKTEGESDITVKEEAKSSISTESNDDESAIMVEKEEAPETGTAAMEKSSVISDDVEPIARESSAGTAAPKKVDAVTKSGPTEAKPDKAAQAEKATSTETKPKPAEALKKRSAETTSRPRSSSTGKGSNPVQTHVSTKAVPAKYQVKEIPVRTSKDAPATVVKSASTEPKKARVLDEFELEQARLDRQERLDMMKLEKQQMAELRLHQRKLETDARAEDMRRQNEDREEQQQIRKEKRDYDSARRVAAQKAIDDAVMKNKEPLTLAQLESIRNQNQFADRFSGIESTDQTYTFDPSSARGPSQTVTYSSRFVDKLTDITDDMMISGALTVKMAKIGGSGKGSFVNSDKFKESDLNFYISVKVTNQTTNFKDALIFNRMRSINIGTEDFNKVYGDAYIGGFEEGGTFNAIISMKIHNKAKLMDIKAEATVALTAGPVDITATANVGIARTNIEMNTETTIQVSWSGGGNIKPMEQPWNIQSVMQAAARFPQLVANAPQRIYAILIKYDSLRSFVDLRPGVYSPIQYENAQIYTNVLMEAFLSFKSLYKKLGDQISSIQNRTLEFEPWPSTDSWPTYKPQDLPVTKTTTGQATQLSLTSATSYAAALEAAGDLSRFEANLAGVSQARKFIRRQMVYIVNEVDLITKDPKIATDVNHEEPFQSPTLFETRIPVMKIPDALKPKSNPLSGKIIMAKTQTEDDLEKEREAQDLAENDSPPLYQLDQGLMTDETNSLSEIQKRVPSIGKHLQVSKAMPKTDKGSLFNNLDFLFPEWEVESITIGMTKRGSVGSVEVVYENGLMLRKGLPAAQLTSKTLSNFQPGERITSAVIEAGTEVTATATVSQEPKVLSVCMYSNRGRRLLGQAIKNEVLAAGHVKKDGTEYKDIQTLYLDSAYSTGTFKGFFGRLSLDETTGGICRLGLIWGDSATTKLSTTAAIAAPVYDIDTASSEALLDSMRAERDQAKKEAQTLATAKEERDEALRSKEQARDEANQQMDRLRVDTKAQLDSVRTEANATLNEFKKSAKPIKVNGFAVGRQSISFKGKDFRIPPSGESFLTFDNGTNFRYQPDGNLVVYSDTGGVLWAIDQYGSGTNDMIFHCSNDGNLIAWKDGYSGSHWSSGTQDCRNGTLVFSSDRPYIEIFNDDGQRRWSKP